MRAQLSWLEQLTLNQWVQGSNPCARTKTKKLPVGSFFCFQRGKGENTGRRVRPQTKGRRSMPVATGNKCSDGEANPCARTKTKKPSFNGRFFMYVGLFLRQVFYIINDNIPHNMVAKIVYIQTKASVLFLRICDILPRYSQGKIKYKMRYNVPQIPS